MAIGKIVRDHVTSVPNIRICEAYGEGWDGKLVIQGGSRFQSYRNPILVVYVSQNAAVKCFVIYTGQSAGSFQLSCHSVTGGSLSYTAAISGNDIAVSGANPDWGRGFAIGLGQ